MPYFILAILEKFQKFEENKAENNFWRSKLTKKNLFGKFITCSGKGKKFRTIDTEINVVNVLMVPDQNFRNIQFQIQTFTIF